MKHLLYVPFTGLGLFGGYRGDTWLRNRIKIFKNFTLQGILNQSDKDFYLWVSFRPQDEENPIVQEFVEFLGKMQLKGVIVTYNGVMFWDDKYPDDIAEGRLRYTINKTMKDLKEFIGDDEVIMTLQPSDDIYLSDAVDKIKKSNKSIGFTKGYMMNYNTLELAEYNPKTLPPFSSIKFTNKEFLSEYYQKTEHYKSHEYVPIDKKIEERMFIVGTHGENISTTWEHPYMGRRITGEEKEDILIKAGLFNVEPLEVKKDFSRRFKKRIINLLPAPIQRKIIRLQSPGVKDSINSYTWFNV